jgi:hypothetical protein
LDFLSLPFSCGQCRTADDFKVFSDPLWSTLTLINCDFHGFIPTFQFSTIPLFHWFSNGEHHPSGVKSKPGLPSGL